MSATATAEGGDDYDPQSWAWNGLAQFVALAEGMGFEVSGVSELDWGTLGRNDILFVIYPKNRVDPKRLDLFLHAGGNTVIADDFGNAEDAMAQLGLLPARNRSPRADRYFEGRLWAPIAAANRDHPLTRNVREVVANHPSALGHMADATAVLDFADSALVVAGERGTGKFVAVADPSIFINRMQQEPFEGNVTLTANILRWLSRGGSARRLVLLRGDATMFGEPQPLVDDPGGGNLGRVIAEINAWMYGHHDWLLTATGVKVLTVGLAITLVALMISALPLRQGRKIHGLWLRLTRPARRDDPHALMRQADHPDFAPRSLLVVACLLRDHVQRVLAAIALEETAVPPAKPHASHNVAEPLYTLTEADLIARVSQARGPQAGAALAKVYRRLRTLPSRGQAAAPWNTARLGKRDFEKLDADILELCRTLGSDPIAAG